MNGRFSPVNGFYTNLTNIEPSERHPKQGRT